MTMPYGAEGDASLDVSFPEGLKVTANRFNTTLYTFFGDLAMYNHVFIVTAEDADAEDEVEGQHVFCDDPRYQALWELVIYHDFPAVLNSLGVYPGDKAAYDAQHAFPYALKAVEGDLSGMVGDLDEQLQALLRDQGPHD